MEIYEQDRQYPNDMMYDGLRSETNLDFQLFLVSYLPRDFGGCRVKIAL